jgi:hypothetical protein
MKLSHSILSDMIFYLVVVVLVCHWRVSHFLPDLPCLLLTTVPIPDLQSTPTPKSFCLREVLLMAGSAPPPSESIHLPFHVMYQLGLLSSHHTLLVVLIAI